MSKKVYIRDKRSPAPKSVNVSKVMSANKAKDTKPEILLRKAIWENGLYGYRINYKNIPGRPDIAYTKKKLAIFVNGCYWHRCPKCDYPLPKHNTSFWKEKFDKNVIRDYQKMTQLYKLGWKVITVWECDIKNDINPIVAKIKKNL